MFKAILPALLAVGLVAVGPMSDAFGQRGGGGGGHGGGGGGGGRGGSVGGGRGASVGGARVAPSSAARVGAATVHSGTMHPGGTHPGNMHPGNHPGHPNHNHPFFVGGIWLGSPFWYNYGPGYIDYGYSYGYPYAYDEPAVVTMRPMTTLPQEPPPATNGSAQIDVVLPSADAKLWIDGNAMAAGSGTQRSFISPPLETGFSYSYRVTASWLAPDGREVRVERVVPVAPGRLSIMDFTKINTKQTMPPAQD